MASIVIAAHNEAAVIGRCLDALSADATAGEFDVTVVANGCTDGTAQVAAARAGVRVLNLQTAGKVAALNAGDAVAVGYPRIYLDADVVISSDGARALCGALAASEPGPACRLLAVTARREVDVSRSPLMVRSYFAINSRLPIFRNALIGRGVIALSAEGRGRFGRFPEVMADDLYLDSLFTAAEKRELASVKTQIAAPRRTRDLVRRLARVRRANAGVHAALPINREFHDAAHHRDRMSWLRDVVLRHPALIPAAGCYVAITIASLIVAWLPWRSGDLWGRDNSSRPDRDELDSMETAGGRG